MCVVLKESNGGDKPNSSKSPGLKWEKDVVGEAGAEKYTNNGNCKSNGHVFQREGSHKLLRKV